VTVGTAARRLRPRTVRRPTPRPTATRDPRHELPPPAAWRQALARVAAHRDAGAGHKWLDLQLPRGFSVPEAGQFVQLLLEPPAPVLLPRPMSVASVRRTARGPVVGFLYAPVGAGTQALAALAAGDHVSVLGPLGRGFPLEVDGTPVLIAGGRGVAPLLFAAEVLERQGRRCEFLFGARDAERLVGLADCRRRLDRMGGRLHVATDDGSRGARGTVVQLLDRIASHLPAPLVLHACGPHLMLAGVARWGMRHGARTFLAMESVMACGTGVCRGCPLPRSEAVRARLARQRDRIPSLYGSPEFAMCCTDGPVFAAEDLDWERIE
jgi:dihydroorotate dehydrogenase electron transfer subunit